MNAEGQSAAGLELDPRGAGCLGESVQGGHAQLLGLCTTPGDVIY